MRHRRLSLSLVLILFLVPGCKEPTVPVVTPDRWLSILAGDEQRGFIARALPQPVTVRVVDRHGAPVSDVPVEWRVIEGGGEVSTLLGTTDASGRAQVTWTLGELAGQQLLMATVRETPAVTIRAFATVAYTSVSAGARHSCAVDVAGNGVCWGDDRWGQLGNGAAGGGPDLARISGGHRFRAIYAGVQHSCGITVAGGALCWGQNADAQLGDSTQLSRSVPVPVSGGLHFAALSPGGVHTCGLSTDGAVYCWGNNGSGQIGAATGTCNLGGQTWPCARQPVLVELPGPATAVTAGSSHSCALLADGRAFCWGRNDWGETGVGRFGGAIARPEPVMGTVRFAALHAGTLNTCGVSVTGEGYCWGMNRGALGTSSPLNYAEPELIAGEFGFETVQVGESHSCGLGGDGTVYCWGAMTGVPAESSSAAPVAVPTDSPFIQLSVGGMHTCGSDGEAIWCWGRNAEGQLGVTGASARDRPTRVADAAPPISSGN